VLGTRFQDALLWALYCFKLHASGFRVGRLILIRIFRKDRRYRPMIRIDGKKTGLGVFVLLGMGALRLAWR
jgi:hypothetical protein